MEDSLLNRAFDVEDITPDFDPVVPPSTGHEYLQHVMYEASKFPQVMVANIDRRKIKNHVNVNLELFNNTNKRDLAPSAEWQHNQVAIFSDLRKKIEKSKKSAKFQPVFLPKSNNEEKWYDICFGDNNSRLEPSLTLLLSMSEPLLGHVLEYQLEWLQEGLKPNQGKWLYALLACLNLPLMPATCSVLRDLARQCAKMRSSEESEDRGSRISCLYLLHSDDLRATNDEYRFLVSDFLLKLGKNFSSK